MIPKEQIETVVQQIVEFYQPEQVILFGSYASGTAHEGSDLDFLLVKETNESPSNRSALLRRKLRNLLIPMDILVFTPEEVAKDKFRKNTFIHEIFKNGKSLYECKR